MRVGLNELAQTLGQETELARESTGLATGLATMVDHVELWEEEVLETAGSALVKHQVHIRSPHLRQQVHLRDQIDERDLDANERSQAEGHGGEELVTIIKVGRVH